MTAKLNPILVGSLIAGLTVVALHSASTDTAAERLDLGVLSVGSKTEKALPIRNPLNQPLVVAKTTLSCPACTHVLFSPKTIPANGEDRLRVSIRPEKAGKAEVQVVVEFDNHKVPKKIFTLAWETGEEAWKKAAGAFRIGATQAAGLVSKDPTTVLIDVRSPALYVQAHVPGSINLPLYTLKTKAYLKAKPVILIDEGCGLDRTLREVSRLQELKFTDVHLLEGGLRAWQLAGGKIEGDRAAGSALATLNVADFHESEHGKGWLLVHASPTKGVGTLKDRNSIKQIVFDGDVKLFAKQLQSLVEKSKNISQVLILTDRGDAYDAIETATRFTIRTPVFYLSGGAEAYARHVQLEADLKNRREVKMADNSVVKFGDHGAGSRKGGGCGSCP
jgi:rhodanese-related sulfurtransferase